MSSWCFLSPVHHLSRFNSLSFCLSVFLFCSSRVILCLSWRSRRRAVSAGLGWMVIIGHRSSKSTLGANSSLAHSCLHDPVIIDRLSYNSLFWSIPCLISHIGSQTTFSRYLPLIIGFQNPLLFKGFLGRSDTMIIRGFVGFASLCAYAPKRVGSTLSTREHWLSTDCRFYFPPSANVPVTPALHRPIGPQITAKKRKRIWFSFFFCDQAQPNGPACFLQVHDLETGCGAVNYLVRNWSSGTCGSRTVAA